MESVVVRRPTLDDASGVAMLLAARDRAEFDEDDPIGFTGDELRDWWAMDEPALATDAWIALRGNEIVGYARASREGDVANLADESCVYPQARGLGIGSRLLDEAEQWARENDLPRFTYMWSTSAAGSWPRRGGTDSYGSSGGWRSS
jgi:GNAT superfamily N-acetyltransferase